MKLTDYILTAVAILATNAAANQDFRLFMRQQLAVLAKKSVALESPSTSGIIINNNYGSNSLLSPDSDCEEEDGSLAFDYSDMDCQDFDDEECADVPAGQTIDMTQFDCVEYIDEFHDFDCEDSEEVNSDDFDCTEEPGSGSIPVDGNTGVPISADGSSTGNETAAGSPVAGNSTSNLTGAPPALSTNAASEINGTQAASSNSGAGINEASLFVSLAVIALSVTALL